MAFALTKDKENIQVQQDLGLEPVSKVNTVNCYRLFTCSFGISLSQSAFSQSLTNNIVI
jgi:hypothetical protein